MARSIDTGGVWTAVAVIGGAIGVLVAVGVRVDVAVGGGVSVPLRVADGVEAAAGVSVGDAVPLFGVGLRVGVDWHPFNAVEDHADEAVDRDLTGRMAVEARALIE